MYTIFLQSYWYSYGQAQWMKHQSMPVGFIYPCALAHLALISCGVHEIQWEQRKLPKALYIPEHSLWLVLSFLFLNFSSLIYPLANKYLTMYLVFWALSQYYFFLLKKISPTFDHNLSTLIPAILDISQV